MKISILTALVAVLLAAAPGQSHSYVLANADYVVSVDDDERMYDPVDVAWDSDGLCYVLFQGSCRVLVLNSNHEVVREFGRCGEGPGEIGRAKTIEILDDRVYIFQDFRLDMFAADGRYLDRRSIGRSITDTGIFAGRLIASSQDGDSLLTSFGWDGEVVGQLGPPCRGKTWDEKYVQCGAYKVVSDQTGLRLVDAVSSGVLRLVDGAWLQADWGIPAGKIWHKDGAVYTRHAITAVCGILEPPATLVVYQEDNDAEGSSLGLAVGQAQVRKLGDLGPEANVRRLAVSPTGELWVLFWGSEISVFDAASVNELLGR